MTNVTAPVVGATKIFHVDGAVKAVELELTEAEPRYLGGTVCSPCPCGRYGTEWQQKQEM